MITISSNCKLESCRDFAVMDLVQEPSCSHWNENGNYHELPMLGKPYIFQPFSVPRSSTHFLRVKVFSMPV